MLYCDNGGVHNLLVGSEPTHCIGYLPLCILHINACLYPPFGDVILYGLCLYYCHLLLIYYPGFVPVLSIVGFGNLGIVSARPINE